MTEPIQSDELDVFMEGWFTTGDGVTLHYVHCGSGDPLIIMPGWAVGAPLYSFCMPMLAKKYHVYVLEHRGQGKSQSPEYGYHMGRIAKDAREFVEHLGISAAGFLGHSMGCAVMYSYIELFGQDSIKKLVLVDQSPFLVANPAGDPAAARLSASTQHDPWKLFEAFTSSWREGWAVFRQYYPVPKRPKHPSPWTAKYKKIHQPLPDHRVMAKLIFNHFFHDWRDIIKTIRVPTLYIGAENSFTTTPECWEWMHQAIKGSRLVVIPTEDYGSHYVMMENPELFSKIVLSFLEE